MKRAIKNFMENFKKNERGMTLVELLAVIVILAIVGAIAFVAIGNVIDNSRKDAQISNGLQAISAAKLYEATNGDIEGSIASGEGETEGELADYLEEVIDPWDNERDLDVSVTRTNDELQVSISGSDECNITATEADLRKNDRDDLCSSGS